MDGSRRTHRSRLRLAIAALAAAGLVWPAASAWPDIAWNLHVWGRLRHAGRRAPDSDFDADNRALLPFLPPAAPVGFSVASIADLPPVDQQRIEGFLRYSIVPHELRLSTDTEFVIEKGLATMPTSLTRNSAFVVVASVGSELRLLRKVGR